jgi:hypothetical protein
MHSSARAVTRLCAILSVATFATVLCCEHRAGKDSTASLVGIWERGPVSTEFGSAIITLEFRRDGSLMSKFTSLDGNGEVLSQKGSYHIEGDHIISDSIGRGEPLPFRMDGNVLSMTVESSEVTYNRK